MYYQLAKNRKRVRQTFLSVFHSCTIPTSTNYQHEYLKHSPLQEFLISLSIMIIYRNWILSVYHLLHCIRMMHFLSWWWILYSMYFKDSWQLFHVHMLWFLTNYQEVFINVVLHIWSLIGNKTLPMSKHNDFKTQYKQNINNDIIKSSIFKFLFWITQSLK